MLFVIFYTICTSSSLDNQWKNISFVSFNHPTTEFTEPKLLLNSFSQQICICAINIRNFQVIITFYTVNCDNGWRLAAVSQFWSLSNQLLKFWLSSLIWLARIFSPWLDVTKCFLIADFHRYIWVEFSQII